MHVDSVVDDLDPHALVAECGDDRAGSAVVDAVHSVERVGELRGTVVEGLAGGLVAGIGVADGRHDAVLDEKLDRFGAVGALRGEGHLDDGALTGVEDPPDVLVGGVLQFVHGVCSLVPRVEEGALGVQTDDPRVGADDLRALADALLHQIQGVGDVGEHRAGGAVSRVLRQGCGGGLRTVVECDSAAAVVVDVNVAGYHGGALGVDDLGAVRGPVAGICGGSDVGDDAVLDTYGSVGGGSADGAVIEGGRVNDQGGHYSERSFSGCRER